MAENCQGGEDLNSRPTPKAFGAALPLQIVNGKLRIFLSFQCAFNPSCFSQYRDLFACDDFDSVAKPLSCVHMAAHMLSKAGIKIDSRADIMSAVRSSKNINPRHIEAARGEIRTPDQGLMSPLLYH